MKRTLVLFFIIFGFYSCSNEKINHYTETKEYGDYFLKKEFSVGCSGTKIKQTITDSDGNEITENITKLQDEVKIGNYTWKLKQNFEVKYQLSSKNQISSFYKADTTFVDKKVVDFSRDVTFRIRDDIFNEGIFTAIKEPKYERKNHFLSDKGIAKNYLFKVDDDLYALYEADFKQPEGIVNLYKYLRDNDGKWLEGSETRKVDIMNLKLTQDIVYYFERKNNIKLTGKRGKELKIAKESDLPIFQFKKFNDTDDYLFYLAPGYEIIDLIDTCK